MMLFTTAISGVVTNNTKHKKCQKDTIYVLEANFTDCREMEENLHINLNTLHLCSVLAYDKNVYVKGGPKIPNKNVPQFLRNFSGYKHARRPGHN